MLLRYKIKYNINKVCWSVIVVILFFTAFLKPLTVFSNLALLCMFIYNYTYFNGSEKKIVLGYICALGVLSCYSLILQNNPANVCRFAFILFFIGISYFYKLNRSIIIKPLKISAILLSAILILGEVYLLTFFNNSLLPSLRNWCITNGIGDIYPKYGSFYAIQIVGTAALPFVFMLSFVENIFNKKKHLLQLILFIGIIIAGNFGFLVSIFFFFIAYHLIKTTSARKVVNNLIIAIGILIVVGPAAFNFVSETMESKKEVSNTIRVEQTDILINDLAENNFSLLFGKGLGNTVNAKTSFRDYTDNIYFELQSIYIFNQLGVIPFFLFIVLNIYFTLKYIQNSKYILLYISYVVYAVTNPYIFNTNQVVVIITLASLNWDHKKEYSRFRFKKHASLEQYSLFNQNIYEK